jgi:hypothetical protein
MAIFNRTSVCFATIAFPWSRLFTWKPIILKK